ncbi:MAG: tetratricopeptide repeat protein, partial [Anaerolineae bacterium]|nr:tetratricopeptide repeat protein [Anaerolineae bacterium]
ATAYYNRATAYHQQGQTEAALADYRTATELNPNDGSALYNMACLLAGRREVTEALTCLQQALETGIDVGQAQTDPDFEPIRADERFQILIKQFSSP